MSLSMSPSKVCMPSCPPTRMASSKVLPSVSPFSTYSRVRKVDFSISITASRPAPSLRRDQALRNDVTKAFRKAVSQRVLLRHGKSPHDSLHRFGGIDGVQGGEDEVAGFGGFHGDFYSFLVPHLAHQNHFRSLAQRGPQGERKAGRIAV